MPCRHAKGMSDSPAQDLADAFYGLSKLEFLYPYEEFPVERGDVRRLVQRARALGAGEFQAFSRELIHAISAYCQDKASNQDALYRAFDGVDDLLEIDYREDQEMMPRNDGAERLYEGGGVGVQTSYTTIVKVLEHLQLPKGSHLVDLGSGFGRVGLATGLWREDLQFSGYEFVAHRVAVSNASAARAGIEDRVRFIQQDLGDPLFCLPGADAFYLYDPFSVPTYQRVFARLAELGRERATSVVVKAHARESFQQWMNSDEWSAPEALDEGTLFVFRSRGGITCKKSFASLSSS